VVSAPSLERLEQLVWDVEDPELPHVTIGDLGIVRSVAVEHGRALIELTPTYTGCPATEQIRVDVEAAVRDAGYEPDVRIVLSPAWTTDWISQRGRQRLHEAGIAPPGALELVACPRCGSRRTRLISWFGSTACKASYTCGACTEPFELFKVL
jgi:ring-1,2-phenylacetyl-CoA epoxidase subunit PaaD